MMNMGYSRKEIEDSLSQNKYDDITATYLLLGRRTMEVSIIIIVIVCHYLALVGYVVLLNSSSHQALSPYSRIMPCR